MTFTEFMNLGRGDGVVIDGYVGTVTDVADFEKGTPFSDSNMTVIYKHSVRQLEISYFHPRNFKVEKLYPTIFSDFPSEVHNSIVLERLKVWDPFQF